MLALVGGCPADDSTLDEVGESESSSTDSSSTDSSESGSSESSSSESSSSESSSTDSGSTDSSSTDSSSGESTNDSSESSSSESETGEPLDPGACLQEVDDPQPDEFVGDGVTDLNLYVKYIHTSAPVELEVGRRIHVQGSYYAALLCGDDDIACEDSFVVRSYPQERLVLAQLDGNNSTAPQVSDAVLAALGTDLATWLHPLELSLQDELLCSIEEGGCENIITRLRLHVDGGECETARLLDETHGSFGDVFHVVADDVELASGGGLCVDAQDKSRVFVVREACEGECPPTGNTFDCPLDDQVDDIAYLIYDAGWTPPTLAVDLVCEVLGIVPSNNGFMVHALDCGMLGG